MSHIVGRLSEGDKQRARKEIEFIFNSLNRNLEDLCTSLYTRSFMDEINGSPEYWAIKNSADKFKESLLEKYK